MKLDRILFVFSLLACFFAAFLATYAHAASDPSKFELVYTAPVETTLAAKDLRDPVSVWTEAIDSAKKTIDFGEMYVSGKDGEPLDTVIEHLEAAGKRGVKIRFLVEERTKGASFPATIERLKKIPNLTFQFMKWANLNGDGIIHAKYFIVDRKLAYFGSQNFDWRALKHIHELGVRVSDPGIAAQIQSIFDHDWNAERQIAKGKKVAPLNKKSVPAPLTEKFYLVASPNAQNPKGIGDSEAELVRLIGEAKDEIRVQLLDYSPTSYGHGYYPPIDTTLRAAQYRKVKVKLMVSHWNTEKPAINYLKSLAVLPGVEVKIVNLPLGKDGFIPYGRVIHSKYMTIDGKTGWVGTSNWSGGYLDQSRNMELVMHDENFAKRLAELHEQLWDSPYAEKIDISRDYPKPKKGAE